MGDKHTDISDHANGTKICFFTGGRKWDQQVQEIKVATRTQFLEYIDAMQVKGRCPGSELQHKQDERRAMAGNIV